MKFVKMTVLSAVLSLSAAAFAADPAMKADNEAINSACAADTATAGCPDMKVGTGLMKCLHAYKKAHKDFKASDACVDAMKKRHADRKAGK